MNGTFLDQNTDGNGQPPVPVAIDTRVNAGDELGEVSSPSQLNTFVECPAKWYFRYLVGLPEPKSGALALGIAVDEALCHNFRQKIDSGEDLPVTDVGEAFSVAWAEAAAEAEFRDDEDVDALHDLGRALAEKYMAEAAPTIAPQDVQKRVTGEIAGVKVQGIIDLLDVNGMVIDFKTASKKPPGIPPDYRIQLTTYDLLCPESRGVGRLDTLVKTKTIQIVHNTTEIGPDDVQLVESLYPRVQDAIRDGVFYPRRTSRICSRKYCAFWRACEREFGGEVDG